MNDLAALALSYAGLAAFALSQSQHTRRVSQRQTSAPERWLLRSAGTLGVLLALWACVAGWGWGVGLVLWTALLTFAVFGVAFTMTYRASRSGR